jgi:glutamine amidotransferase PdxT
VKLAQWTYDFGQKILDNMSVDKKINEQRQNGLKVVDIKSGRNVFGQKSARQTVHGPKTVDKTYWK